MLELKPEPAFHPATNGRHVTAPNNRTSRKAGVGGTGDQKGPFERTGAPQGAAERSTPAKGRGCGRQRRA